VDEANQRLAWPPRRGDASVVRRRVGAKEPPRRPRQVGGNRGDDKIIWTGGEPVICRVGQLEHVAMDAGVEAVSSSGWDDEERMAAGRGVGLTGVGVEYGVERLIGGLHVSGRLPHLAGAVVDAAPLGVGVRVSVDVV